MTVLVVFCPCAFILATPAAVAAAIGNLTRYGILIRTGDALQRLAEVECIAFDKTGTLTYGKPAVTEIAAVSPGSTSDGILMLAAAAEQNSEHPLGKAVLAACMKGGSQLLEAVNTTVLAGQGISAEIASRRVIVGKPGLMEQEGIDMTGAAWKLRELYVRGATVIAVAADGTLMGLIALSDTVREDTPDTVAALKEQGITPVLLTGDNEAAAGSIARIAGISEVRSSMMQEDKMSFIKESGRKTAMIGDGVNDALALYAGMPDVSECLSDIEDASSRRSESLKDAQQRLTELQQEFFTEVRIAADEAGISMPEPSAADLIMDDAADVSDLVRNMLVKKQQQPGLLQKKLSDAMGRKSSEACRHAGGSWHRSVLNELLMKWTGETAVGSGVGSLSHVWAEPSRGGVHTLVVSAINNAGQHESRCAPGSAAHLKLLHKLLKDYMNEEQS